MKQTLKYLSMALVLAGMLLTGCTGLDEIDETREGVLKDGKVTLTATISFDAATKALTADGVKTFEINDKIAVAYTNTSSQRVKAVSLPLESTNISEGGKKATFTVTLNNPVAGSVDYIYPASMCTDAGEINYAELKEQYGGLYSIESRLDCAKGTGTMLENEGVFALPMDVTLENQFAILRFDEIKNKYDATSYLAGITNFSMSVGSDSYVVSRYMASSDPIYLAVRPFSSGTKVCFNATDGTHHYTSQNSAISASANHLYPVNLSLEPGVNLTGLGWDITLQDGETVTGTLTETIQIFIADGASVTLNNVDINGSGTIEYIYPGITCLGDATINLSGTNTVNSLSVSDPGIFVPSGSTLTINGPGSLDAEGGGMAAGIGGGSHENCGSINICGGTISAVSGTSGAGIGGGDGGDCENITISGGTVSATGGFGAAGIGGGEGGDCGDITISGGTVSATGLTGIGCGAYGDCGIITISGGSVTATAYYSGMSKGTSLGKSSEYITCTGIYMTTGITQLTLINSSSISNDYVSYFINADVIMAGTVNITTYAEDDHVVSELADPMTTAGFLSTYVSATKTWSITKP